MDNNTCLCDNCLHAEVCKYKDELDRKMNILNDKGSPIYTFKFKCKFYKLEKTNDRIERENNGKQI